MDEQAKEKDSDLSRLIKLSQSVEESDVPDDVLQGISEWNNLIEQARKAPPGSLIIMNYDNRLPSNRWNRITVIKLDYDNITRKYRVISEAGVIVALYGGLVERTLVSVQEYHSEHPED